jgi:hypothetical protein
VFGRSSRIGAREILVLALLAILFFVSTVIGYVERSSACLSIASQQPYHAFVASRLRIQETNSSPHTSHFANLRSISPLLSAASLLSSLSDRRTTRAATAR